MPGIGDVVKADIANLRSTDRVQQRFWEGCLELLKFSADIGDIRSKSCEGNNDRDRFAWYVRHRDFETGAISDLRNRAPAISD